MPPKPKRIIQALKDAFPSIPRQFSFTYIRNNAQFIIFHILFFVINLSLIVSRLVEFRHSVNVDGSRNWAVMIARAGGQCLNFTCMFVLLPMLRLSVTKLRQKGFNYLLPLVKHTSFHRMTGHLIVVYSLIHTLAHIVNLGELQTLAKYLKVQSKYLFQLSTCWWTPPCSCSSTTSRLRPGRSTRASPQTWRPGQSGPPGTG